MSTPILPIRTVRLELLRAGPAYNQLLSPLTDYIALCGPAGPVTLQLPFEHQKLLTRLSRLQYPADQDPATDRQRQAELADLGETLGQILAQVPALIAELGNVGAEPGALTHLSLSMSALELGLLPFEAAIAAEGFPAAGSPLLLQNRLPITLTREIRRGQPLPMQWAQTPKILFAFAQPAGSNVPAQAHLQALREAIEPWVRQSPDQSQRLADVKKLLTVLPQASLEQIRQACATDHYTHVHILAHGAPFTQAGDQHFGVALCSDQGPEQADVVDGERLALALCAADNSAGQGRPTVVTLATCDSGNINTVLTPGASIAHQLNAAGIPWVIASQFPLWMRASAIAVRLLYTGLLNGDDPRWVLHQLRQRLRTEVPQTHDWASIVAYATIPADFASQVSRFRQAQIQWRIGTKFARIDELLGCETKERSISATDPHQTELTQLAQAIRQDLTCWRQEGAEQLTASEKSKRLGVSAASEKRLAIAFDWIGDHEAKASAYDDCYRFYREAWELDSCNHWLLSQYLSILALRELANGQLPEHSRQQLASRFGKTWCAAVEMSDWKKRASSGIDELYALATLAELYLLQRVYQPSADPAQQSASIADYCSQMSSMMLEDDFPLQSTLRQFRRYQSDWQCDLWSAQAELAVEQLSASG